MSNSDCLACNSKGFLAKVSAVLNSDSLSAYFSQSALMIFCALASFEK